MSDHRPFDIKVGLFGRTITMSGDLDGSREVYSACREAALNVGRRAGHWTIDAREARLPRGGVEVWIAIEIGRASCRERVYGLV